LASIFFASRWAAPVSRRVTICSMVMRPWSNASPLRNTVGTAITWRSFTSSWNSAPSMATCLMLGLTTLIRFSACTVSGQLWQDSDMKVSKRYSPSRLRTCSSSSGAALDGWPPTCSRASTSEVNSWPSGMPAKRTCTSVPTRLIAKEGLRASWPVRLRLTLSDSEAMSSSSPASSCEAALSSREATSSIGCVTFSR